MGARGGGVVQGPSQLSCGLGNALRDLGELQAGAFHHAGLTAALVGTGDIAAALAVQLVIFRACIKKQVQMMAEAGSKQLWPSQQLPMPPARPPTATIPRGWQVSLHSPTWNEVLLFGWGEKQTNHDVGAAMLGPMSHQRHPKNASGAHMGFPTLQVHLSSACVKKLLHQGTGASSPGQRWAALHPIKPLTLAQEDAGQPYG
jgi:hypothetical protein